MTNRNTNAAAAVNPPAARQNASDDGPVTPAMALALIGSEQARKYIEPMMPEGVDLNRVAASLALALQNDESGKLKLCTRTSLVMGVARIAAWGLELGRTAHLLPFGGQAVPCPDYRGLIELMVSTGTVRSVDAKVVREGDEFNIVFGINQELRHVPVAKSTGKIIGAYCIFRLRWNQVALHYMTVDEIEAIRQKYSKQWKSGPLPSWYALKTVIRQGAKFVPMNPKLAAKLAQFDAIDTEAMEGELLDLPGELDAAATLPASVSHDVQTLRKLASGSGKRYRGENPQPAEVANDPDERARVNVDDDADHYGEHAGQGEEEDFSDAPSLDDMPAELFKTPKPPRRNAVEEGR